MGLPLRLSNNPMLMVTQWSPLEWKPYSFLLPTFPFMYSFVESVMILWIKKCLNVCVCVCQEVIDVRVNNPTTRITDRIDPYSDVPQVEVFCFGRIWVNVEVGQREFFVSSFRQTFGRLRVVAQRFGQTLQCLFYRISYFYGDVLPFVVLYRIVLFAVHVARETWKLQTVTRINIIDDLKTRTLLFSTLWSTRCRILLRQTKKTKNDRHVCLEIIFTKTIYHFILCTHIINRHVRSAFNELSITKPVSNKIAKT